MSEKWYSVWVVYPIPRWWWRFTFGYWRERPRVLISDDVAEPTVPSGYRDFRRVGRVRNA